MAAAISASCLLDDDDSGDGTNYVAPADVLDAYKDAQCTHLAMCGVFPDKDSCLAAELVLSTYVRIDPSVEAAIYAGHVIYNGANVKTCIDSFATKSCDRTDQSWRITPPECSQFFRGTLMSGEACYVDEECASQRCSSDSGGTCALGQCVGDTPPVTRPAEIGQQCFSSSNGCVVGAYCDQTTGICTALKGSGVTCTVDSECAYGLGCKGTTGGRMCASLPTIGQPCATDGVCRDEGSYCDFTADMCKQIGVAGAQCTSSTACSPYYPCVFTTSPGVCTRGPSLGQPCSSSNRCFDAGTYCDFSGAAVCVAQKTEGQPCNSSEECINDFCDFNTQQCATPMSCF